MPYFQITIEVAGLNCPLQGEDRVAGFYTNRLGRGANQDEAFGNARRHLLVEDKVVNLIEVSRKNGGCPPQVFMTEARAIPFWKYLFTRNQQGLALYPEDAQKDE